MLKLSSKIPHRLNGAAAPNLASSRRQTRSLVKEHAAQYRATTNGTCYHRPYACQPRMIGKKRKPSRDAIAIFSTDGNYKPMMFPLPPVGKHPAGTKAHAAHTG